MADQPEASSQILTSAHKSFEAARAATTGVSKAAALWAAALAIVWMSSLEPALRSAVTTALAFREINDSRHDAERRVMIRLRPVIAEEEEVERLKRFEAQFPAGQKREQERNKLERNLKEAREKLNQVRERLPGQDMATCEKSEDCRQARAAESSARDKMQQFEASEQKLQSQPLADRERQLAAVKTDITQKESSPLRKSYDEAKKRAEAQERNVSFELFGLSFKAPPLLAPLLWCIFCVALLGYLAKARATSSACCAQGFRILAQSPGLSGDELANLAERLPTWTIGPALSAYADALGSGKDRTQLVREPWVDRVFGSLQERQLVAALTFLIPFLGWFLELRVAWIALEFSRYVGTTRLRAVLPLALLAILGVTAWIGGWWFSGEWVVPSLDTVRRHWLVGLCALPLTIAGILVWHPSVGIHFGFILQQSLLWIALISVGLLMVGVGAHLNGVKWMGSRAFPRSSSGQTRRGAMITIAGIAALVTLTTLLASLRQGTRTGKDRKHGPQRLDLTQGFYRKQRRSGREKAQDQRNASFAAVLHYVGPKGRISRRGSFPSLENLVHVPALTALPSYELVEVSDEDDEKTPPMAIAHSQPEPNDRKTSDPDAEVAASLWAARPSDAAGLKSSSPRVHLATASWSFEEAALAFLPTGAIGPSMRRLRKADRERVEKACQLLLCGIQHDLLFKQRINNERKKGRPSFRLYDLLAGISIRYGQEIYFEQLLKSIKDSKQQLIFQTRVEKWQDATSAWHQKWRNRGEPVIWRSNTGAVVF